MTVVFSRSGDPLNLDLDGELCGGMAMRSLYATDASEYQEMPLAVAFPASEADVRRLIQFAGSNRLSLIPRTAGTSLAGQVVGSGIVVDLGRRLNRVVQIDAVRRRVRVQPGVVRNELNQLLNPHGMLFGPETATANRAMIGGMVGNNSCGSNSVVYGSTRDHLVSCRGFLSDGSEVTFAALGPDEFQSKCEGDSLEAGIYRCCRELLGNPENRSLIRDRFPKRSIPRRNTGYALDLLMDAQVFDPGSERPFNLCRLIAGSEGTLFIGMEFELDCDPLPPPRSALLCVHFETVGESLQAVGLALTRSPFAVELIDRHILEATARSLEQRGNRFFVHGDPGAILAIEIRRDTEVEVDQVMESLISSLRGAGLGYHFPLLRGTDQGKVWELRRAGQGLMMNMPGDAKPREVVEDTAVDVVDLPAYIEDFDRIMREKHGIDCVYYAHAGTGEIHTRPVFDLKTRQGLKTFRAVAEDIAELVKTYQGSLSGEHGDGRLRGEFIPFMVGEDCYGLMRQIKNAFDPHRVFNPGKIIDPPPMDTDLRVEPDQETPAYETLFDFSGAQGVVRAAEQCNGTGECRKGHTAGGVMCPSYMATRNEKDSTRARANLFRHVLTHPDDPAVPFDSDELNEILDLCLSCKGCKRECPANVDMAKLKAEFLQHRHDAHGAPRRARLIANFTRTSRLASRLPWIWNPLFGHSFSRRILNRLVGMHPDRTIPRVHGTTLTRWFRGRGPVAATEPVRSRVYLFADEFTEYNDMPIGRKTVTLLEALGYEVQIPDHLESARTWLSKGFLREARDLATGNIRRLAPLISEDSPLIGIEPSALLGFRDEYIDLAPASLRETARSLGRHCLTVEEFLSRELEAGRIGPGHFTTDERLILLHGHCFQKALASVEPTVRALGIPANYRVEVIPSGCCGMAGSFGYEVEHYDLSMRIGELVLFPAIRNAAADTLVAAPGTSCRHQIHDGTRREALHPVEILHDALNKVNL